MCNAGLVATKLVRPPHVVLNKCMQRTYLDLPIAARSGPSCDTAHPASFSPEVGALRACDVATMAYGTANEYVAAGMGRELSSERDKVAGVEGGGEPTDVCKAALKSKDQRVSRAPHSRQTENVPRRREVA